MAISTVTGGPFHPRIRRPSSARETMFGPSTPGERTSSEPAPSRVVNETSSASETDSSSVTTSCLPSPRRDPTNRHRFTFPGAAATSLTGCPAPRPAGGTRRLTAARRAGRVGDRSLGARLGLVRGSQPEPVAQARASPPASCDGGRKRRGPVPGAPARVPAPAALAPRGPSRRSGLAGTPSGSPAAGREPRRPTGQGQSRSPTSRCTITTHFVTLTSSSIVRRITVAAMP